MTEMATQPTETAAKKAGYYWTAEFKEAVLREKEKNGWGWTEAAKHYNVPVGTLRDWAHTRAKPAQPDPKPSVPAGADPGPAPEKFIARNKLSPDYKRWAVLAMKASGLKQSEFCAKHGIHATELSRWVLQLGLRKKAKARGVKQENGERPKEKPPETKLQGPRRREYSDDDKRRYLQLAESYPSAEQASRALDVSAGNLSRWKREAAGIIAPSRRSPRPPPRSTASDAAALVPVASSEVLGPARTSRSDLEQHVSELREDLSVMRALVQLAIRRGFLSLDLTVSDIPRGRKG